MDTRVYLLNTFFTSAKDVASELRQINVAVQTVSGGDMTPIRFGGTSVGIAFTSSANPEEFQRAFAPIIGQDKLAYLITEVATLHSSYGFDSAGMQWIQKRL